MTKLVGARTDRLSARLEPPWFDGMLNEPAERG